MWQLVAPWIRRLDSESAHRWVINALARFPRLVRKGAVSTNVGLAAGFDKNAEILVATERLGFGFTEIGTVTPRPQIGNARPRMWRIDRERSLFNRMGFNNDGAVPVARRVAEARSVLASSFQIGVSVGKNKDTPLESAARDYVEAAEPFENLVDYVAINVSSPNTSDLRSLQEASALDSLVQSVREVIVGWKRVPHLYVKLAPEVQGPPLTELVRAIDPRVDGYVLTNTVAGEHLGHSGGWSGAPLAELSRNSLTQVRAVTSKHIISVGGILSADEARARFVAGANRIQVYAGLVFLGPDVVRLISGGIERPSSSG